MKRKRRRAVVILFSLCLIAMAIIVVVRFDKTAAEAPGSGSGNTAAASPTLEAAAEVDASPSLSPIEESSTPEATATETAEETPTAEATQAVTPAPTASPTVKPAPEPTATPKATAKPSGGSSSSDLDEGLAVVAEPESITALVNKQNKLPDDYEPSELVYPDVAFIFSEKIDKRKMRKVAADALEELFAGAKKDKIYLAGVSAYRSQATQKSLFDRYVKRDGLEKARTYSAIPGTSEHQTGLAIDVSGSDGKCAAESCFGGTDEAEWLGKHAYEYGFIIRYPEGKDKITGYKYEPWHLRYVGKALAKELTDNDETLEEYYNAIPVSQ
ncbi:D-alanyl-D-alanine carboxypeptidase family protein [Paenibacillus sp. KS-LC4]|uniref:D-alanyl-D-alanine carboxypeptidase family protein n=1 Tax=Paenibacillus sp. KS-LC4 TaxID=2979727 RepID=UPI0030D5D169